MRTILIAQRNVAFSNQLAGELRDSGYHVIDWPGPWPPAQRCIRCDVGYCPLAEGVCEIGRRSRDEFGVDQRSLGQFRAVERDQDSIEHGRSFSLTLE